MASFHQGGFAFCIDREGVTVSESEPIEHAIEYEDFGGSAERAALDLGERLSRLTGEVVEDEEGIFDLAVYRAGELVAALVLSAEEEELELTGERVTQVKDQEIAEALTAALASKDALQLKH